MSVCASPPLSPQHSAHQLPCARLQAGSPPLPASPYTVHQPPARALSPGAGGQPGPAGGVPGTPLGGEAARAHRRLEETSSSLAAALHAVEAKLDQDSGDGSSGAIISTGNILDDIGSMFDDLADQLDAMLD